ncbi:MAG: ribonuclease HII [Nitrososphaerota archaeon]
MPKGPVIGPMVICGFLIEENKIEKLKEIDVKDSKLLSPIKRKDMTLILKKIAKNIILIKLSANEIDKLRKEINLNEIEINKIVEIINSSSPNIVIIDSPEINTKKFINKIKKKLKNKNIKIIAENYADRKYPVVSAASVIAKVERDKEIEKIKKKIGYDFGSGYASDKKTIDFLKYWLKNHKEFPEFVRKSWMTIKLLKIKEE